RICCLATLVLLLSPQASNAGSATWKSDALSNTWLTATNWTPETIPNGPSDIATFAVSNQTLVSLYGTGNFVVEVGSIVFNPGASAFTIAFPGGDTDDEHLTISGSGIINNSGILQSFNISGVGYGSGQDTNAIIFTNSATAGSLTQITVE